MKKIIIQIDGMTCSACSSGLEKYIKKQKGIKQVNVNLVMGEAYIEYEDFLTLNDLKQFVKDAGFEVVEDKNQKIVQEDQQKSTFLFFLLLSMIMMYVMASYMFHFPILSLWNIHENPILYNISMCILAIPFLIYGWDILKNGYKNLIHKMPNMDTLVSIGVISSFSYSTICLLLSLLANVNTMQHLYFESSAMVILFIKLGRLIDSKSKAKTKEAIQKLVQITPEVALLKEGGKEKVVSIDMIQVGDILIAKPGMKIAVDSVIVKGSTHVDESFITGESVPAKKKEKDSIVAGSMNIDGYIEYKAQKIGKDSVISQMVSLVKEASNTKTKLTKVADRVSGYFVPIIIALSVTTLLGYCLFGNFKEAIPSFVSVLVVACPCALGLATPLAIVVSEGICAKKGILVKNGETLESAHQIDIVVFDKTGTLTYGELKLSKIYNREPYKENELLTIVSSMESYSDHPISKVFHKMIKEKNLKTKKVTEFENIPGIGITGIMNQKKIYIGSKSLFSMLKLENPYQKEENELTKQGCSLLYVIEDMETIGLIGVKDVIRKHAKKAIESLKENGKDILMLTGDNKGAAELVAQTLGINHVMAGVMPVDKIKRVEAYIKQGKKVMMVGDGINDAPSLASATIGMSIYSGTDIAMNSADVILMGDDLRKIEDFILISRDTIKIMKQNLFWAFFYNICMIPLAMGIGRPFHIYMNPILASICMVMSSLTVTINTLRLWKREMKK